MEYQHMLRSSINPKNLRRYVETFLKYWTLLAKLNSLPSNSPPISFFPLLSVPRYVIRPSRLLLYMEMSPFSICHVIRSTLVGSHVQPSIFFLVSFPNNFKTAGVMEL